MRPPLARTPLLCIACAALAGCPEERPGATREIPAQRLPPAVSLEPAPAAPPGVTAPPAPDAPATPSRPERRPKGP